MIVLAPTIRLSMGASIALLISSRWLGASGWVVRTPPCPSAHQQQRPAATRIGIVRPTTATTRRTTTSLYVQSEHQQVSAAGGGSLHGQNSCFMPLQQLDSDAYMPRVVQIAGAYPGLTRQDFEAVTSEPSPERQGQWTYDFSDPDGPQLGTVALPGSNLVASCQDPVVVIAEHFSLGITLPEEVVDPVDLLVLVDRAKNVFGERKFLVLDLPGEQGLSIAAFNSKSELPEGSEILGQVDQVTIPWLPCMQPTKTGFLEADEYF